MRVVELGRALGLTGIQAAMSPTKVELIVGAIPDQRVYSLRVQPAPVGLDGIGRLDRLAAEVVDGRVTAAQATVRVEGISAKPLERPSWLIVAAYGLAGSALAAVLGGGWRESAGAALVGLLVGIVVRLGVLGNRSDVVVVPLAALTAAIAAAAIAQLGLAASVDRVTLASLVVLLPGMTLTIGMRELATNQLQSGLANAASAFVTLLGLVFGVAAGTSIADHWFGAASQVPLHPFPHGIELAAAIVSGLAFTVTLRAPVRDMPWICAAALTAVGVDLVASEIFGSVAGVFAAAVVVGLAGNAFVRLLRRSALIFIVPGVLLLVPGSAGFESTAQLLEGETTSGVDAGFGIFMTALAIVYGLVVSTLVAPLRDRGKRHGGGDVGAASD